MSNKTEIDTSLLTYVDWITFYFDRPIVEEPSDAFEEYDFAFCPARPAQAVDHLTTLCRGLKSLTDRFTWEQIGQGLWKILYDSMNMGVDLFWIDQSVICPEQATIEQCQREDCLQSMYCVFADVVQHIAPDILKESIFFMWWDIVACAFCHAHGHWERTVFSPGSTNGRRTHEVTLGILQRILNIDEERCIQAALHGLGHLCHARGAEIVQEFLDRRREPLEDTPIRWIEECRDGTVM